MRSFSLQATEFWNSKKRQKQIRDIPLHGTNLPLEKGFWWLLFSISTIWPPPILPVLCFLGFAPFLLFPAPSPPWLPYFVFLLYLSVFSSWWVSSHHISNYIRTILKFKILLSIQKIYVLPKMIILPSFMLGVLHSLYSMKRPSGPWWFAPRHYFPLATILGGSLGSMLYFLR